MPLNVDIKKFMTIFDLRIKDFRDMNLAQRMEAIEKVLASDVNSEKVNKARISYPKLLAQYNKKPKTLNIPIPKAPVVPPKRPKPTPTPKGKEDVKKIREKIVKKSPPKPTPKSTPKSTPKPTPKPQPKMKKEDETRKARLHKKDTRTIVTKPPPNVSKPKKKPVPKIEPKYGAYEPAPKKGLKGGPGGVRFKFTPPGAESPKPKKKPVPKIEPKYGAYKPVLPPKKGLKGGPGGVRFVFDREKAIKEREERWAEMEIIQRKQDASNVANLTIKNLISSAVNIAETKKAFIAKGSGTKVIKPAYRHVPWIDHGAPDIFARGRALKKDPFAELNRDLRENR